VLLIAAALLPGDRLAGALKQSRLDCVEIAKELVPSRERGYTTGLRLGP
jgi:hypothetical protein